MRPTRIFKSEAFRVAALFAVLFLALAGVLIGTVLWIVDGAQESALTRANDVDIATVTNGFSDEGVMEAMEEVRQRLRQSKYSPVGASDVFMLLQDERGEKLIGNLPRMPHRLGVFAVRTPSARLVGHGVDIADGLYLYVGRDTAAVVATRDRIIFAFAWMALGASVIALGVGIFLGTQFMQRVDAVARTCKSIIAGHWHERIALRGLGDEWDRLAAAINEMLNRIAALLENLRQMSSDVAHDLRTPLARMRNRLEEARNTAKSPNEYSRAISGAIEDTDQILSMFAALLRISQVQAGSRLSTFATISLTDICDKVFQMYLPVAEDYRHSMVCSVGKDILVRGDGELLLQMMSNLLENAITHTPEGTRIRIALSRANGVVRAEIEDDGPGIPISEREKVLQRFYRLSTSRSMAGHGLGLALVAAIAELHHAGLRLSEASPGSTASRGLKVEVTFPVDPAA